MPPAKVNYEWLYQGSPNISTLCNYGNENQIIYASIIMTNSVLRNLFNSKDLVYAVPPLINTGDLLMDSSSERNSSPESNSSDEDVSHLREVETALEEGRLTIIFGAGISIGAIKDSTAPRSQRRKDRKACRFTWSALILRGLDFLRGKHLSRSERRELKCYYKCLSSEEVAVGTMLRAATFLRAKLKDFRCLQRWLDLHFKSLYDRYIGEGPNSMLDSIQDIHNANARIMTTNYDDLICQRCDEVPIIPDDRKKLRDFFSASHKRRKRILHIHGVWSDAQSIVLDSIDYYKITNQPFLQHALQSCMGGNEVLLFVGTGSGLQDPNFSGLLQWADEIVGEEMHSQYILLPDDEPNDHPSIRPIHYGDYSQLPTLLSDMARRVTRR